jgi:hypothetical protein
MKKFAMAAVAALASIQLASAQQNTIVDNTLGGATRDGTVVGAEYVGGAAGVHSGFGNVIGSSSFLYLDSDNSGNLFIGIDLGGGGWNDSIVIYIDSVSGGFSDTTTLEDQNDPLRNAISGDGGGNQSELTFGSEFVPDYAIALRAADNFAGLWQLAAGGNLSLNFVASANLTTNGTGQEIELQISLANIGIAAGDSFGYVATLLNQGNAFRSDEFNGVATTTANSGNVGQNPLTLGQEDYNVFQTIPEPGTFAFMAVGALGLLYRRLRRQA